MSERGQERVVCAACLYGDGVMLVAYMLTNIDSGRRRVHPRTVKMFGCTPKRWSSFLWRVIAIDGMPQ